MKRLAYVVMCLAFILILGCVTKSEEKKATAMPDPHAGIFAEKCVMCHDLKRVEDAHKTKTKLEMKEIIKTMQQKPNSGIDQNALDEILMKY